eukprot:9500745-Pyramimonas_sp.AAC.1
MRTTGLQAERRPRHVSEKRALSGRGAADYERRMGAASGGIRGHLDLTRGGRFRLCCCAGGGGGGGRRAGDAAEHAPPAEERAAEGAGDGGAREGPPQPVHAAAALRQPGALRGEKGPPFSQITARVPFTPEGTHSC